MGQNLYIFFHGTDRDFEKLKKMEIFLKRFSLYNSRLLKVENERIFDFCFPNFGIASENDGWTSR